MTETEMSVFSVSTPDCINPNFLKPLTGLSGTN